MTEASPSRPIFHLVDQDRLSPVAAYDLSKQFSQPIRIFGVFLPRSSHIHSLLTYFQEPNCSKLTQLKRKIREPIYISIYFISTLCRSMLGFTFKDPAYSTLVFGETFTMTCARTSRLMQPLNSWACEGAWLLAQFTGFLLLLPLVIVYQTGKGMEAMSKLVLSSALNWIYTAARNLFLFLSHLSIKGWIMVITLFWLTVVEIMPFHVGLTCWTISPAALNYDYAYMLKLCYMLQSILWCPIYIPKTLKYIFTEDLGSRSTYTARRPSARPCYNALPVESQSVIHQKEGVKETWDYFRSKDFERPSFKLFCTARRHIVLRYTSSLGDSGVYCHSGRTDRSKLCILHHP